jgi:hypothetical protein
MRAIDVMKKLLSLAVAICFSGSIVMTVHACGQVTFERLLNSSKEPKNWLT